MTEYRRPKTRIKVVEDGNGVIYYPQYLSVLIPFVIWEWMPIHERLGDPSYLPTLDEAKGRIDRFLTRHKNHWLSDIEWKDRMKAKKKARIIDYP